MNIVNGLQGQFMIHCQAEILVGVDNVDKMVRYRFPLGNGRLTGADIHIAVDLAAIGADYLKRKEFCQVQSKLALPYSSRPYNSHQFRAVCSHGSTVAARLQPMQGSRGLSGSRSAMGDLQFADRPAINSRFV